jgi:peptidoglycan/xylan/chitin deacetylase (PgdA/CDA1 family)
MMVVFSITTLYVFAQQGFLKEIPVLCYHQIRNYTAADGANARAITVTPERFAAHMKMLADNGYTTILPDDLYAYYTQEKKLPPKPVMITFDDNTLSQYTQAMPILNCYGFKAVFFVMTVSIGKPGYMTRTQMKQLHDEGHVLGIHTWDHHAVTKYTDADWKTQLDQPMKTLQQVTGVEPRYFAFPYGVWDAASLLQLEKRGIRLAFILMNSRDEKRPLMTVRRLMVAGSTAADGLKRSMEEKFR